MSGKMPVRTRERMPAKASVQPPRLTARRASLPIQRKPACACGGRCPRCQAQPEDRLHTGVGMQAKLNVGPVDDPLEREADRVADQVMAGPAHLAVGNSPPRIQRFPGQAGGQMDAAPASVDGTLASPGSPLNPALRQDMEQRFGRDFSRVRVHSGPAAEQSAQDVNANAYTAGNNIVFDAGRFAPGTHEGMRLLSHELTHVVQQSGAGPIGGVRADARPAVQSAGPRFLQRDAKHVRVSLHPEETGSFSGSFKLPGSAGLLHYIVELRNVPALLLDPNNRFKLDFECESGIRTILQEQLKSGPLPSGMPALHISVDAGYSKAQKDGHVARLVRRAGRAELQRAISQAQKANIRPAPVTEPPSFRRSAPVLAELASEVQATFSPVLEGSRNMLVGDDTPSSEELIEQLRRLGVDVNPAPPPTASTVTTDCLALLDTDPQAYVECDRRQRLKYSEDIQKGTMSVTEPIAAGLEAVNPLDPVNLATGGILGIVVKGGKVYRTAKAVKATRASIYAAKWGDEGAELIERAISQRGSISSHFGKLPANYQVHHIVPVTALKNSEVVQAAIVDGFQFNNKVNAIALPRTVHMAYHNKYIDLIKERLQKWAADNPGFTPKQARDFLENDKVGIYGGGLVEEWRRNWISVL